MVDDQQNVLLERLVQGHEEAFESIFRQFEVTVYSWILRIVRDRNCAEDVLVETFWRAYRARASFDPSRSFGAWIRTIATNASLDHLRAQRSRARWIAIRDDIETPKTVDSDLNESVAHAFRKLSPKLQVVASLALIEERPYQEIADALNLPVGTVKSRAFRAVRVLRKELARLGVRP